jgi:two-component system, sensor histidine kinase YesM
MVINLINRLRFQTKFFIYYSLIIVLILSFTLFAFYFYISRVFKDREIENLTQLTIKTSDQVDGFLNEMDRTALYAVANPVVRDVFSKKISKTPNTAKNNLLSGSKEGNEIEDSLVSLNLPTTSTYTRTSIYNISGDYISIGILDSPDIISQIVTSKYYAIWYSNLIHSNNTRIILSPHKDFWSNYSDLDMISLIREITDVNTSIQYGIVEVQSPLNSLDDILQTGTSTNITAYLIDDKGNIIYPVAKKNDDMIASIYLNFFSNSNLKFLKVVNPITQKTEIATYYKSDFSKWSVIMTQTSDSLLSGVKLIGITVLLCGLGIMFVTLIVIFFITNQLAKPLKILRKSVKEVSLDNLTIEIDHPESSNEIQLLNEAFSGMFRRLKDSMNEVVQIRAQEMKAHMLALQAQIDPHFIYNMLSVISASSREAGPAKVSEICQKLSNMLRYTTSFNEDFTSVKDELDHVSNYLQLMKLRFEDQFSYDIMTDERLIELKIDIPKLTLQPLIENCFKHGFKKVLPPWVIRIELGCNENNWFVSVSDNGIGFDEAKIEELKIRVDEFINNPSTNIKNLKLGGMGLINTIVRLKLLYKDEMIFNIENGTSGGTKITIGGKII